MTQAPHPDEVQRLRCALWGDAEVERHAAQCPPCAADVAWHRKVRDTFGAWFDADVPDAAVAAAQAAARADEPLPAIRWIPAVPVGLAGARAAGGGDLRVARGADGLRVDVILHPVGGKDRLSAAGQIMKADATPLAKTLVTLFVDGRAGATARTDDFGEFEFDPVRGSRLGLRIGSGEDATHVEILPGGEAA